VNEVERYVRQEAALLPRGGHRSVAFVHPSLKMERVDDDALVCDVRRLIIDLRRCKYEEELVRAEIVDVDVAPSLCRGEREKHRQELKELLLEWMSERGIDKIWGAVREPLLQFEMEE
jgi:hypothetical protein